MTEQPVLLPRRGSVYVRKMIELVEDGCAHGAEASGDHTLCLLTSSAASWTQPHPFADLDDDEVMTDL